MNTADHSIDALRDEWNTASLAAHRTIKRLVITAIAAIIVVTIVSITTSMSPTPALLAIIIAEYVAIAFVQRKPDKAWNAYRTAMKAHYGF